MNGIHIKDSAWVSDRQLDSGISRFGVSHSSLAKTGANAKTANVSASRPQDSIRWNG
jgi:hypothetical protein